MGPGHADRYSRNAWADPQRAATATARSTGLVINYSLPRVWRQIAQAITEAAVPLPGDGLTDGQIRKWVGDFMESHPTETTIEAGVEHGHPFEHKGAVWFRSSALRASVAAKYGIDLSQPTLSGGLKRVGFKRQSLNVNVSNEGTDYKGERRTQVSCCRVGTDGDLPN